MVEVEECFEIAELPTNPLAEIVRRRREADRAHHDALSEGPGSPDGGPLCCRNDD